MLVSPQGPSDIGSTALYERVLHVHTYVLTLSGQTMFTFPDGCGRVVHHGLTLCERSTT